MDDKVESLTVEILKDIRDEMRGMRAEMREQRVVLVQHGDHLSRLQGELCAFRAETRRELMKINARLLDDDEVETIKSRLAAVESRVDSLERH